MQNKKGWKVSRFCILSVFTIHEINMCWRLCRIAGYCKLSKVVMVKQVRGNLYLRVHSPSGRIFGEVETCVHAIVICVTPSSLRKVPGCDKFRSGTNIFVHMFSILERRSVRRMLVPMYENEAQCQMATHGYMYRSCKLLLANAVGQ
jgi:hypothetical protein